MAIPTMSLGCCLVKGCPKVEPGGCLFRFPKESTLRKQWLQRLQLTEEDIGISGYVCGRHFNEKHLTRQTNGTILLHREAVPEPVLQGEHDSNSLKPEATSSNGQPTIDSPQGSDQLDDSAEGKRRQTAESMQTGTFKQASTEILESVLRQLFPKGKRKRNKNDQPNDQQEMDGTLTVVPNESKTRRSGRRVYVNNDKLSSQEGESSEPLTKKYQPRKTSTRPVSIRSANLNITKTRRHAKRHPKEQLINGGTTKNNPCQECANGFRAMESHVKRLDWKLDTIVALLESLKQDSSEKGADSTCKKLPKRNPRISKQKERSFKVFTRPNVSLRWPDKRKGEQRSIPVERKLTPPKPIQISRNVRTASPPAASAAPLPAPTTTVVQVKASTVERAQKSDLDMAMGKAVLLFLGRGFSTYHLRKFGSSVLSDVSPLVLNACIEQLTNEGLLKSLGQLELRFPNVNSKTQMNFEVFKKSPPTIVLSQQLAPYGLTREAYAAAFFGRHHSKLKQINVLCDADEGSSASA
uniref:THAP-type domain-containing protein n=1 Tax=Trichuris muris TaxID=70415 RepID=A0A5S6PZA7_TRIMR